MITPPVGLNSFARYGTPAAEVFNGTFPLLIAHLIAVERVVAEARITTCSAVRIRERLGRPGREGRRYLSPSGTRQFAVKPRCPTEIGLQEFGAIKSSDTEGAPGSVPSAP